eukprot:jgi/Botrbrau1/18043/Bobra.0062s0031.1
MVHQLGVSVETSKTAKEEEENKLNEEEERNARARADQENIIKELHRTIERLEHENEEARNRHANLHHINRHFILGKLKEISDHVSESKGSSTSHSVLRRPLGYNLCDPRMGKPSLILARACWLSHLGLTP